MKNYTFTVVLVDSGLPYPDFESAKIDCEEWAHEIAVTEMCEIASATVMEDE